MSLHGTDEPYQPTKITGTDGASYILLDPKPLPPGTEGPTTFLGKGAFGTVSIAITEDMVPLAVKKLTLDKTAPNYAATIAEIEKETRIMRHLGRPADLIVQETTDPNKVEIYVIQPFIAGMELQKYFEQLNARNADLGDDNVIGKLNLLKEAITSWIATMEATQQLHAANVIHGDLHTGNVLYDPISKQATIIDFGMSHQLEPGQEKSYTTEESPMQGFHRAPETFELKERRDGHPPERVYDRSTDHFSLAIDFGVASDFSEHYAPDEAGKEIAQIFSLCKALSQEPILGGNGDPSQRISLEEGIARLKGIQSQIDVRIWQQQYVFPRAEIQQLAKQKMAVNSLQQQILAQQLPPNIKQEIKEFSKLIKKRWQEINPPPTQPHASSSAQHSPSPLARPSPVLPSQATHKRTLSQRSPESSPPNSPTISTQPVESPPPKPRDKKRL